MKKIVFNIVLLIILFGLMYFIGNRILYPIDDVEYVKSCSKEYNIDPFIIISIANSNKKLAVDCFATSDNSTDCKECSVNIKKAAYLFSKYKKSLSDDQCLRNIGEKEIGLASNKAKEYSLNVLRNKSWYKIFHYELKDNRNIERLLKHIF